MKYRLAVSLLFATSLFISHAHAHDGLAAVVAGVGGVLGHSVGGIAGAAAGASLVHGSHHPRGHHHWAGTHYQAPVYHAQPVYYYQRPLVMPAPGYYSSPHRHHD